MTPKKNESASKDQEINRLHKTVKLNKEFPKPVIRGENNFQNLFSSADVYLSDGYLHASSTAQELCFFVEEALSNENIDEKENYLDLDQLNSFPATLFSNQDDNLFSDLFSTNFDDINISSSNLESGLNEKTTSQAEQTDESLSNSSYSSTNSPKTLPEKLQPQQIFIGKSNSEAQCSTVSNDDYLHASSKVQPSGKIMCISYILKNCS